jgi:ppGpp synthetase/RelA/SpoT-type nucleotidyltranferase
MKTYHQYQSESKQAEQKLRIIQQQMAKIKSVKKQKTMEKRVEKVKFFTPKRKKKRLLIFLLLETNEIYRNKSKSI